MKKNFKTIFSALMIISVVVWLILIFLLKPHSLLSYLESWFYWIELLFILNLAWIFRLKSGHIMHPALGLIIVGALLNIFGANEFAETVLRTAFVGLIVGVAFTLVENYKQHLGKG